VLTDYTIGPPSLSRRDFLGDVLATLFHRLTNTVSVHDIVAREHRHCLPATDLHDDVLRHPGDEGPAVLRPYEESSSPIARCA
jgi:hypothetical protein